jgi:hypothetical protein
LGADGARAATSARVQAFEAIFFCWTVFETQSRFARLFYARADYTDFMWHHGGLDHPNFSGWVSRAFGAPAQTLEISRHRWRRRSDGQWIAPRVELDQALGPAIIETLAEFHAG